jgi:hypothetical protein
LTGFGTTHGSFPITRTDNSKGVKGRTRRWEREGLSGMSTCTAAVNRGVSERLPVEREAKAWTTTVGRESFRKRPNYTGKCPPKSVLGDLTGFGNDKRARVRRSIWTLCRRVVHWPPNGHLGSVATAPFKLSEHSAGRCGIGHSCLLCRDVSSRHLFAGVTQGRRQASAGVPTRQAGVPAPRAR